MSLLVPQDHLWRSCLCALTLALLALLLSENARCQTPSTGALVGAVLDPTGAVIPSVVVHLINRETGTTETENWMTSPSTMLQKHIGKRVYTTEAPDAVSWYRPHLETSLALIELAADPVQLPSLTQAGANQHLSTICFFAGIRTSPSSMSRKPPLASRRTDWVLPRSRCIGLSGANPWDMMSSVQPLNDLLCPESGCSPDWVLKTTCCSPSETRHYDNCWGRRSIGRFPD
jgi:hypothetical protein